MTEPLDDARGELLACPFCGNVPQLVQDARKDVYIIRCRNDGCEVNPVTSDRNKSDAIEAWNTRPAPVPQCEAEPVPPRCDRCGSSGDVFMMCAGCQSPLARATPPSRSDAGSVEAIARVLYECEKRRATNADAVIKGAFPKASDALLMEPWEDCKDCFLSDAQVVLAALVPPPLEAGRVLPKELHWLGDRESADATRHALDMTGCVAYFEQQSDCLQFMRWLESLSPDPSKAP